MAGTRITPSVAETVTTVSAVMMSRTHYAADVEQNQLYGNKGDATLLGDSGDDSHNCGPGRTLPLVGVGIMIPRPTERHP